MFAVILGILMYQTRSDNGKNNPVTISRLAVVSHVIMTIFVLPVIRYDSSVFILTVQHDD